MVQEPVVDRPVIHELQRAQAVGDAVQRVAGGLGEVVVHWVSATEGLPCEFRLYDRLFKVPRPEQEAPERGENAEGANAGEGFLAHLNPDSLRVMHGYIEPSVPADPTGTRYQLERLGYFWPDPKDSRPEALVMNRIVTLSADPMHHALCLGLSVQHAAA